MVISMLKLQIATLSLVMISSNLFSCPMVLADGKQKPPLKGSVSESEYLRQTGPSLSRADINRAGDPFGSNAPEEVVLQAPESMFDVHSVKPPPPPARTFPLRAEKEGDNFEGVPMDGFPDSNMVEQQPLAPMGPPPGLVDPNDPDSSKEMQLAWDLWHRRVAEAIYTKFNSMAQVALFKYGRPLAAKVNYTVTRDHRIVNAQLTQRSSNVIFNAMLLFLVNSLNGHPILEFPSGSRRMSVEKGGVFTQNYGQEGFRFTTGDRETIRLRH